MCLLVSTAWFSIAFSASGIVANSGAVQLYAVSPLSDTASLPDLRPGKPQAFPGKLISVLNMAAWSPTLLDHRGEEDEEGEEDKEGEEDEEGEEDGKQRKN